MQDQQVISVFCYAFRPLMPMDDQDGGFTINLLSNDMLVFNTYDIHERITYDQRFQLREYTRSRYLRMVDYAAPWLTNVPAYMCGYEGKLEGEYSFGFNGMPLRRVENLQSLITGDFRNPNAHYARKLYCLMEDIATLLAPYGFSMSPDSFNWSSQAAQLTPGAEPMLYSNLA